MDGDSRWPTLPTDELESEGWTLHERREERLFQSPTGRVDGYTLVYEDDALRNAVREATDDALDRTWRFFFVTRLAFTPPLAPGVGPAAWLPTVRTEARRAFEDELEERGFEDVTRARGSSFDGAGGARSTRFTATYVVDRDGDRTPTRIEAWLLVRIGRGDLQVVGGAYPARGLQAAFSEDERESLPPLGGERFREELFELFETVE